MVIYSLTFNPQRVFMNIKGLTKLPILFICFSFLLGFAADSTSKEKEISAKLKITDGYQVEFLSFLESARLFAFGPDRELLIGSKSPNIYRLRPPYEKPELLASIQGAYAVHSLTLSNNYLYAADSCAVYRAEYPSNKPLDFKLFVKLPCENGGHYTRTIISGPQQQLFVSLGISGNCSNEFLDNRYTFEKRRGGIFKIDTSGQHPELKPYASGLRNPIGMTFYKDDLYATNAGSDNLGYELPPEVIAKTAPGSFHGMPWYQYFNGQFNNGQCTSSPSPVSIDKATTPFALLDARSTPMGIDFPSSGSFKNMAIVAVHGSWGQKPGGGRETRRPPRIIGIDINEPTKIIDIVSGLQRSDGSRLARPVGVLQGPDGHIYFSSDGGELQGIFRLKAKY